MRFYVFLCLSLGLFACSNQNRNPQTIQTEPVEVSVNKVKAVVLYPSSEKEKCTQEIKEAGVQILYQNDMGMAMLDKVISQDSFTECRATVSENKRIEFKEPKNSKTPKAALEALLKLIPAEEMGARTFVQSNPSYDGRGVIIAVLDTGIELDHLILKKTKDGKDKIVDFQDFSGEGRVELSSVSVSSEGKFKVNGQEYSVNSAVGKNFSFGIFQGCTLIYSDVSEVDQFEDVGIITYQNSKDELRGRVDTNNNKDFSDDEELYSFKESRKFARLGKKKLLSAALTLGNDGKTATLSFDNGSHGTHVAGIAAGYSTEGLSGVAPGAQVVAAKIGDNRLSGGSTTTASMLLAIDYAVSQKAKIINFSYGIRGGSNIGKSAIDQYVDKVALEKDILFSISAGNEGPGLLTIGTPAGAELAITSGAYVSKETAKNNYGYLGVEDDNTWFFSSVGPLYNGGWKPSLIAPGTALSSVPQWSGEHANYRGTSMAAPETSGALALLLSAALQKGLLTDRASITRAIYDSTKVIASLNRLEQGHGLLQVPGSLKKLETIKTVPVEYGISVNNSVAPGGRGAGIFTRSLSSSDFTVTLIPKFQTAPSLSVLELSSSADWITHPSQIWIQGAPKTFQVKLSEKVFEKPGLYSELITAKDVSGQVAFEVPVTVVVPQILDAKNAHEFLIEKKIRVGQTLRYFVNVPAGTTSATLNLSSDGPVVWAQLLDGEGRRKLQLIDTEATSPMPSLFGQTVILRPGLYEIDVVAPAYNTRATQFKLKFKLYSLTLQKMPSESENSYRMAIQNNFEPLKIVSDVKLNYVVKQSKLHIDRDKLLFAISLSDKDRDIFSGLKLRFLTSPIYYDLMTDYPFRIFDSKEGIVVSTGLELDSEVEVPTFEEIPAGNLKAELQGAFTKKAPEKWTVDYIEKRLLKSPLFVQSGQRVLMGTGQEIHIPVSLEKVKTPIMEGYENCPEFNLYLASGEKIQGVPLCDEK